MEIQRTSSLPRLTACSRMPEWMRHFGRPAGFLGSLAGHLMAVKNRKRSLSVLALVAPRPGERILEVGFGPGVDIHRVSRIAAFVAGVDSSPVMVRQALRRNTQAIRAGKVELQLGAAHSLDFPDDAFDKVFSINSAQFWPEPFAVIRELQRVLKVHGRIVLAVQPRSHGANAQTSQETASELVALLSESGFQNITAELRPAEPVPIACVIASKSAPPVSA